MGSRCQYFIKLLWQLMDRFLRPRESDCIRLLWKDTTSSRAGRLANCRNPPPKLVKPAIREDKEFFEKPSCHRRYFENFPMSARGFPSSAQEDSTFSLNSVMDHRKGERPVKRGVSVLDLKDDRCRWSF